MAHICDITLQDTIVEVSDGEGPASTNSGVARQPVVVSCDPYLDTSVPNEGETDNVVDAETSWSNNVVGDLQSNGKVDLEHPPFTLLLQSGALRSATPALALAQLGV